MNISFNESAIVGCGCSLATEEVASRSDIPVVSFRRSGTMEHCRNWSVTLSVIVYDITHQCKTTTLLIYMDDTILCT